MLYDYEAAEDNEITLVEGQIITGIQQLDEGWWSGITQDGQEGLFPATYVELLPPGEDEAEAAPEPEADIPAPPPPPPPPAAPVAAAEPDPEPEADAGAPPPPPPPPPPPEPTAAAIPEAPPAPPPPPAPPAPPAAAAPAASSGPYAVALYDYAAAEDNELSFEENDRLEDIEFPSEDWWSGVNVRTGDRGLFPGNYVEYHEE